MCFLAAASLWLGFTLVVSCHAQEEKENKINASHVLSPPYNYFLMNRSSGANTTFTTRMPCVELEYIVYNDTSDLTILDTRNKTSDWNQKMFEVSVSKADPAVLHFEEFEPDAGEGPPITADYAVIYLAQNCCYIVEKRQYANNTDMEVDGKRMCELWIVTEKDLETQEISSKCEVESKCLKNLRKCARLECKYILKKAVMILKGIDSSLLS
uniref:Putative secreted protein n=1 Tax=Amblyomma cajennense TaxID=34607 RepID=A0A023FC55_AMBCJ